MELSRVTFHKVTQLPQQLLADAFYYILDQTNNCVDYVITDNEANPISIISKDKVQSYLFPYDTSQEPQEGQILVFRSGRFSVEDLANSDAATAHINRTDNPHQVNEAQLINGVDYTLLFENALI